MVDPFRCISGTLPVTPDPILYSDDAKLLECHRGYGCRFWIVGLSRKDPKALALAWPEINGINPARSFTDKPRIGRFCSAFGSCWLANDALDPAARYPQRAAKRRSRLWRPLR